MAATIKKKSPTRKKPVLKNKTNKVSPYLIAIGAIVVAIIGALIVRGSFAGSIAFKDVYNKCNTKSLQKPSRNLVLSQGSQGSCVMVMQYSLKKNRFMSSSEPIDGKYGSKTANSVLLFESYYGLRSPNKVADYCTWYTMYQVFNWDHAMSGDRNKVIKYAKNTLPECF